MSVLLRSGLESPIANVCAQIFALRGQLRFGVGDGVIGGGFEVLI